MRSPNGLKKAYYILIQLKGGVRFYFIADYPDSIKFPSKELEELCEKDPEIDYITCDFPNTAHILKQLGYIYKGHLP